MQFWPKKNNTNFPDFWQEYLSLFNGKDQNVPLKDLRFVAFDTETTGFDYTDDRVLSIGAIGIKNNSINVSDQLEVYLKQDIFNEATVEIHGIRKNGTLDKISEGDAILQFIRYIGNAVLIAHHANFDRIIINKALQRQGLGDLKNKIIDTGVLFKNSKHQIYHNDRRHYSLDELCSELKISKSDRHTASGDAFITAMAFLKIIPRLKKDKQIKINELLALR